MDSSKSNTALFDVFLRLRPSSAVDRERFLDVERIQGHEPTHITIKPPVNDTRKKAVEKFAFTRVFEEHAGQRQLFEDTGAVQLVQGVLGGKGKEGKDGLLATLGVTGSGKSHTILGSRSQRGITQLTLDLLFQHLNQHLVDIDTSPSAFHSLCTADVAESQLYPAANFLDSLYSDTSYGPSRGTTPARGATPARGTTPALVRESSLLPAHTPGAFPGPASPPPPPQTASRHSTVFDRLYPSLAKYQRSSHFPSTRSPPKSPPKSSFLTRSIAKLTASPQHETSFLSAPGSRRTTPRVSTLPTYPPIDDVAIDVDGSAEYAIVISMYEVHNDRIFDLLSGAPPQKRRALLYKSTSMSPDRKVVAGLKKVVCSDLEEALLVLETGLHERRVAGTGSNATSSRSHGFFCIEVKKRARPTSGIPISKPWTSSTLTIVDLAGSERARIAKTAGATLAEAGKINESLMYLGQCMQMQADNANAGGGGSNPGLVPFRQCKLTELLFSNSLGNGAGTAHKAPQKSIMVVTADPLGDFNSTSQILRYSALAREIAVPRIPSITSTILSGTTATAGTRSGRTTPSALQEELENALSSLASLREELEVTQLRLEDETRRREEAEASWKVAESRIEEVEAEVREEVFSEMEARLQTEQRRWRAARDEELDAQDEHLDRKLELLTQNFSIYEDDEVDQENRIASIAGDGKAGEGDRVGELEDENERLREQIRLMEREREGQRSPSKKMRVLKTRKWTQGSDVGLDV